MNRVMGLSVAFAAVLAASPARAGGEERDPVDIAVNRGLEFLSRTQGEDGAWRTQHRSAVTALCLLAFLSSGHTPTQNLYAPNCRKAVEYLVRSVPEDGYVGKADGSRMYGQGIVSLALAEALGMEGDRELRARLKEKLELAVEVILSAQARKRTGRHAGGWRYQPTSNDSDLSLTGWCALALRAAKNCGLEVPESAVAAAADYVRRNYNRKHKGFTYQGGRGPSLAMTGVGILALHLLGREEEPEANEAAAFLLKHKPNEGENFFYYSLYYSTQAANQLGGEVWEKVWSWNSGLLLRLQSKDGSWPESSRARGAGRPYSTALAALALSVRYHYLPSYQK